MKINYMVAIVKIQQNSWTNVWGTFLQTTDTLQLHISLVCVFGLVRFRPKTLPQTMFWSQQTQLNNVQTFCQKCVFCCWKLSRVLLRKISPDSPHKYLFLSVLTSHFQFCLPRCSLVQQFISHTKCYTDIRLSIVFEHLSPNRNIQHSDIEM